MLFSHPLVQLLLWYQVDSFISTLLHAKSPNLLLSKSRFSIKTVFLETKDLCRENWPWLQICSQFSSFQCLVQVKTAKAASLLRATHPMIPVGTADPLWGQGRLPVAIQPAASVTQKAATALSSCFPWENWRSLSTGDAPSSCLAQPAEKHQGEKCLSPFACY